VTHSDWQTAAASLAVLPQSVTCVPLENDYASVNVKLRWVYTGFIIFHLWLHCGTEPESLKTVVNIALSQVSSLKNRLGYIFSMFSLLT
jgi:hypothetical protein